MVVGFMSGRGGGGGGEGGGVNKADVFLVQMGFSPDGEMALIDGGNISCPVAKVGASCLGGCRLSINVINSSWGTQRRYPCTCYTC